MCEDLTMNKKIAFLGVGNMASAVITANGGKTVAWNDIILFDKITDKCMPFIERGAILASTLNDAICSADCIFLAVKPQDLPCLMAEICKSEGHSEKLYISIAAGIEVETISSALGSKNVVRALPNTPMLIGKGVSAVCKNANVPADDYRYALSLFESAGRVIEIDENEMNRIIGVTSSAPAYVFRFVGALLEGAAEQGLSTDALLSAVCDVVSGSAELLKASGKSCEEMIAMVASKGGTTERALSALTYGGFDDTIKKAMADCTTRADEMGKSK